MEDVNNGIISFVDFINDCIFSQLETFINIIFWKVLEKMMNILILWG